MNKPSFTKFLRWSSGWTLGFPRWLFPVGVGVTSLAKSGNVVDLIASGILCFAVLAVWYFMWDGKQVPKYKSFRLAQQKDDEHV